METDFNYIYNIGYLLVENQLLKYDNNILNYDCSYKIIDNDTIKIKLKNYHEKMYFITKLENDYISLYSINGDFLNSKKIKRG